MAKHKSPLFMYVCAEENCGMPIKMTGRFRLTFWEIPYTIISLIRFALKYLVFMPLLFSQVLYTLLYAKAWLDYNDGILKDAPTNPFRLEYVLYSDTDPNFIWEGSSLKDRWMSGFVCYTTFLFIWFMGLGYICRTIREKCATSFWSYRVAQ
jgi:hypothetical protein